MIDNDRLTLLAFAIGEWQAAIAHLEAMQKGGVLLQSITRDVIEDELDMLCEQWTVANAWPSNYSAPMDRAFVLSQARYWATTHLSEIAALTEQEGTEHDSTGTTSTGPGALDRSRLR